MTVLILGGNNVGVAIADRVLCDHKDVLFLDSDSDAVARVVDLGGRANVVDITDAKELEAARPEMSSVEVAIVTVERDTTALLVGQLAKTKLNAGTVIVLMHDLQNRAAFETAGMVPVCATTELGNAAAASVLARLRDSDPSLRACQ